MRNQLLVVQHVVLAISLLKRNLLPAEVLAVPVTNLPRRSPLPVVQPVVLARNRRSNGLLCIPVAHN